MPKFIRKYIGKASREELASFVPAALALTIVVVIALFIFENGRIFQVFKKIDVKQRVSAALRDHTGSELSVLTDELIPVDDLNLVLSQISNELSYRISTSNVDDALPYTALYRYDETAPLGSRYIRVSDCFALNDSVPGPDSKCPIVRDDDFPAIKYLEHKYVVATRVTDTDSDDTNDLQQVYAARTKKGTSNPPTGPSPNSSISFFR